MVGGSCLCGRFAFEADGPFSLMSHCHCGYCRKSHGSTFATYVAAPARGFRWLSGKGEQGRYESSPGFERPFCPTCGSKLPGEAHGDLQFLPAGLLDGDPVARPEAHIFTAERAPWDEITDGIHAFEGAPPGWTDPGLATRPRPEGAGDGAIAGSCLCGAVAWELGERPARMGNCHCSRCRKVRAAAFSTQVFVPHERFRWLRGRDALRSYALPDARFFGNAFCASCASPVPRDPSQAPLVLVPAGPLDDDPGVRPQAHIYVGSKAPWFEITDGLPRFEEMPSG